jgi:hypothetical protein
VCSSDLVEVAGQAHALQADDGVADLDLRVGEVPREATVIAAGVRETVALSPFRTTLAAVLCGGPMPAPTTDRAIAAWAEAPWKGRAACEAAVTAAVPGLSPSLQRAVLRALPASSARQMAGPESRWGVLQDQLREASGDGECAVIVRGLVEVGQRFSRRQLHGCGSAGPLTRAELLRGFGLGVVRERPEALVEAEQVELRSLALPRLLAGDESALGAVSGGSASGVVVFEPPVDGLTGLFVARERCAQGPETGRVVDRVLVLGADRRWVALRGDEPAEVQLALCGDRVGWRRGEP